jgi:hypothetical protein
MKRIFMLAAGVALLAAACGGSPGGHVAQLGSTSTQSSLSSDRPAASAQHNGVLAFSRCMRSHGVPSFPDSSSSGALAKETPQQLGVSLSQFQAAQNACQHLLPNGGNGPDQAEVQQIREQGLKFVRCMHDHGVTLPDPGSDGRIPDSFGAQQGSPQFQTANQACRNYRPAYIPSNAAYDAWARAQGS